jgi:hypothetical protein
MTIWVGVGRDIPSFESCLQTFDALNVDKLVASLQEFFLPIFSYAYEDQS